MFWTYKYANSLEVLAPNVYWNMYVSNYHYSTGPICGYVASRHVTLSEVTNI